MAQASVNKWHILAIAMAGSVPSTLDSSMLGVSLPSIASEFSTDIGTAQWVISIYRLIIVSLLLTFGRLGDMLGHRRIFMWGLLAFSIASVFAGLSQNIGMLIAFRVPQGVAAAMKMAVGHAIIAQAFPPAERGKAFGFQLANIGLTTAIGPALGGIVTEFMGWRSIFAIDVVIAMSTFFVARRVRAFSLETARTKGQTFDRTGASSLFLFLLSLLVLVNRGPAWGWGSTPVIALWMSVFLWAALFIRTERRVPQPVISLSIFTIRAFSLGNMAAFLAFMAQHILLFLTPFYLQMVLHLTPKTVGLTVIALSVTFLVFSPLSGALSDRIGTRRLTFIGPIICAIALLLMSQALFGLGMAIFQSPNNSAIMTSIPPAHLGVGSSMINMSRNMGWLMGTVLGAAILYALLPSFAAMQQETGLFLQALKNAYLLGAVFSGLAALAPLVPRGNKPS
ncbi:MAG: drug resistance transporter, EmrB/QacA subfamily [Dehalococcoidia bacterium]|nr:drug resistance transporter, EmrB/QacA subfamily [Dehalococcoidia bacterium]